MAVKRANPTRPGRRRSSSSTRAAVLILLLNFPGRSPLLEAVIAQPVQTGLPFKIKPEQLPDTVIRFRVASTKVNSGWDEIVIGGDGKVILRASAAANHAPKELAGRVEPLLVMRLLQLFRAEGIEGWRDEYRAKTSEFVAKVLTIEVKGASLKEVVVSQPEFPEFARVYGAIKLVASRARAEVLTGGFFQRIHATAAKPKARVSAGGG